MSNDTDYIMQKRVERKAVIPKEITFLELKEIIAEELLSLEKEGYLTILSDYSAMFHAYCIAVEIENALKEDIYG